MNDFKVIIIDKGASSEILREKYSLDIHGITNWARDKRLITDNQNVLGFKDLQPWNRTGAETYCASFELITEDFKKIIIIKAIVSFNPEKAQLDWARRREILSANHIPVSNWYYHDQGIIIEDYYPESSKSIEFKKNLEIGYKLDQLGFSTLKFIDDIRADKIGNPFFTDFGFDLGEPSTIKKENAKDCLHKYYPEKYNDINSYYKNKT